MRRSTFTDQPVNYASVGATLAADMMSFPPPGMHPLHDSIKLGSGEERFQIAHSAVMTWSVQTNSGIRVSDKKPGSGAQYQGVIFDEDGAPAVDQTHRNPEATFGPDGTPYITAGMTATLDRRLGWFHCTGPVRVVYVVDEPRRVGFACGTMDPSPLRGEESFVVEHRDDDSVWLSVRTLTSPATWQMRLLAPYLQHQERLQLRRYLRALHPVNTAS